MSILFRIFTAIVLYVFFISLGIALFPNATGVLPTIYGYGLVVVLTGFVFFGVVNND